MKFLAVFAHWVDNSQPGLEIVTGDDIPDMRIVITAKSESKARAIAERYEGIETNAHEGIGRLKSITPVVGMPENATPLEAYEGWLRPRPANV
ncbi:MAG: hypothetical protein V4690_03225 [Patescibacteria group bacterium]